MIRKETAMKPLFCVLAVLLFATPAQAGHKVSHSPPGHELLCDCVISEVRQSVFENSERLVFDRNIRDVVGTLMVLGAMECTEPTPESMTPGEAYLRHIILLLDGIQSPDQEFCR